MAASAIRPGLIRARADGMSQARPILAPAPMREASSPAPSDVAWGAMRAPRAGRRSPGARAHGVLARRDPAPSRSRPGSGRSAADLDPRVGRADPRGRRRRPAGPDLRGDRADQGDRVLETRSRPRRGPRPGPRRRPATIGVLVRALVSLLGRRRREDHPHPDPAALTAARRAARPAAAPRPWRRPGPRAIVAAHGPLAPARRRDRPARPRRDLPRSPGVRARAPARLGGRLPRVPPAPIPGHAAAPAPGRGAASPGRRVVPGTPLGAGPGARLGGGRAEQRDRGRRGLGRLPRAVRASARSRSASCEVEREPFPLPTASIDAVLFCELFEHLHLNPFHTLKEIFRVLRPGGLLLLTTPNLRRVETLSRLWHGWGTQPPVSRTFHELFPSLLYHRHNREYTADELAYYLALQGKDLYDFRLDRVYYSDALDAPHEIPGVLGQRVGAARAAARAGRLRRLFPRLRGQLMARAWRTDATLVEWSALRAVEGFGPVEEDERPTQGFTRRLTFPFRLTAARAGVRGAATARRRARRSCRWSWPIRTARRRRSATEWALDGGAGGDASSSGSSPRPVRVHLLVPATVAARGAVRVERRTTATWRDPFRGREVGLHVGAQWVLAQRLAGTAGDRGGHRARPRGAAGRGVARGVVGRRAEPLPPPTARFPATLELGPGDEDQLGPGWFGREDWGQLGAMRWTRRPRRGVPRPRRPGRPRELRPRLLGRAAARSGVRATRRGARGGRRARHAGRDGALHARARHLGRAGGAVPGAGRARARHDPRRAARGSRASACPARATAGGSASRSSGSGWPADRPRGSGARRCRTSRSGRAGGR